ncbi:MAG: signal peptidase I [Oscillospiraceae bacterium]|nr:signal peptidase I [Oscillospiraceae bacterium]
MAAKSKKKKSIVGRVIGNICFILALILAGIAVFNVMTSKDEEKSNVLGFKPIVILSGSMEPYILTDAVILVKTSDFYSLKKDDVITFRNGVTRITHRIVDIIEDSDGRRLITKGDAVLLQDGIEVTEEMYLYKVVAVFNWVKTLREDTGLLKDTPLKPFGFFKWFIFPLLILIAAVYCVKVIIIGNLIGKNKRRQELPAGVPDRIPDGYPDTDGGEAPPGYMSPPEVIPMEPDNPDRVFAVPEDNILNEQNEFKMIPANRREAKGLKLEKRRLKRGKKLNRTRSARAVSRISAALLALACVILLFSAAVAIYVKTGSGEIFGYRLVAVRDDKMEAKIRKNAVVVVKKVVSADELQSGDTRPVIAAYRREDDAGGLVREVREIQSITRDGVIHLRFLKGGGPAASLDEQFTIEMKEVWDGGGKVVSILNWVSPWVTDFADTPFKAAVKWVVLPVVFIVVLVVLIRLIYKTYQTIKSEKRTVSENPELVANYSNTLNNLFTASASQDLPEAREAFPAEGFSAEGEARILPPMPIPVLTPFPMPVLSSENPPDPGGFDPGDLDFGDLDISGLDLSDIDFSDLDFDDFNLDDFNLEDLGL